MCVHGVCVCVRVCACVRACVRVCVCVCGNPSRSPHNSPAWEEILCFNIPLVTDPTAPFLRLGGRERYQSSLLPAPCSPGLSADRLFLLHVRNHCSFWVVVLCVMGGGQQSEAWDGLSAPTLHYLLFSRFCHQMSFYVLMSGKG